MGCGKQREATAPIPGKTAALVPEFAVEAGSRPDFGRTAA